MARTNAISVLRAAGLAEAVSFLALVGVGMPLKYLAGWPGAVRAFGWAHGVLFVTFCVALAWAARAARWPAARAGAVFVAALVPLGPFVIDRRMRAWGAELERVG